MVSICPNDEKGHSKCVVHFLSAYEFNKSDVICSQSGCKKVEN